MIGHGTQACALIGPWTADIILILTDINMICVTDMSRKYCELFKLDIKNNNSWQAANDDGILLNTKLNCHQTKGDDTINTMKPKEYLLFMIIIEIQNNVYKNQGV